LKQGRRLRPHPSKFHSACLTPRAAAEERAHSTVVKSP
jgi:hypothetical protein